MQSACHIHYIQMASLLKETSKVMPPVSTLYADVNLLTFYEDISISVYLTHYFPIAPVRRWDKTSVALRLSTMAHPITEYNCSLQEES